MSGLLPKFLEVDGEMYKIDTDFRTALLIMQVYNDGALSSMGQHVTMLQILFTPDPTEDNPEPDPIIPENIEGAIKEAMWYLNLGMESIPKYTTDENGNKILKEEKGVIDYEKDEQFLFSAVNSLLGKEVREEIYMHWWTFYGFCQSVDNESLISTIIGIRTKKNKGIKLDQSEEAFYKENRNLIEDVLNEDDYEKMLEELA